ANLLFLPYKSFIKKVLDKADKIICVSEYERTLISSHFPVKAEKIVVIPNGVNKHEFKDLKREKKDFQTILYVGRLEKYKGVHYLVKALKQLDENIILEIIGKGTFESYLIKLARKLGVEKRVLFRHDLPRKDLLKSYVNADLFVLLSKYEAYGITVLEALTSGTPCLVAKTSALQEFVDEKNCFGIDYPIDINELSNLITALLGKKIVNVKCKSWDDVVNNLIEVYEEVSI
ncbi:MAG: glycosyltransferase, partial [Candidatus Jordarchaeaceae archaeon]